MKLNRKGYMTIEIILAAVVTFVIAFFLIDITMKLSSNTDDAYSDTVLITDKTLITKNIKENLENDICEYGNISSVNCADSKECHINFENTTGAVDSRTIEIVKNADNSFEVRYGDGDRVEERMNFYSKKIDKSLSDVKLTSSHSNGYYNFKISGRNIFVDENYDMNIFVYNECR